MYSASDKSSAERVTENERETNIGSISQHACFLCDLKTCVSTYRDLPFSAFSVGFDSLEASCSTGADGWEDNAKSNLQDFLHRHQMGILGWSSTLG